MEDCQCLLACRGPRVNRRRGSRTLTSRICVKCGTAMAVPAAPYGRLGGLAPARPIGESVSESR